MRFLLQPYLEKAKIGGKQSHRNLTVYPLLMAYQGPPDYITLEEALTQKLIEVVEIDEEGAVPELEVINRSGKKVLILDSEELVGAKQNRAVNTTILIKEYSTTVIPVICVEQGRWSYTSRSFGSRQRMMPYGLRAKKAKQVKQSLRFAGSYTADQEAIWKEISGKAGRRGAGSPTMAMSEIYEKEGPSIREYMESFRVVQMQVGAVFMVNGEVAGLDSFRDPETFVMVFPKLLESYALDAIDWFKPESDPKAPKSKVTSFLSDAKNVEVELHPAVGLGVDCRLESDKLNGFALVHDNQVLHLSVFARGDGGNEGHGRYRMKRF